MKITLESTDEIIAIGDASCRIWEGQTATGLPLFAVIAGITPQAHATDEESKAFEAECIAAGFNTDIRETNIIEDEADAKAARRAQSIHETGWKD